MKYISCTAVPLLPSQTERETEGKYYSGKFAQADLFTWYDLEALL